MLWKICPQIKRLLVAPAGIAGMSNKCFFGPIRFLRSLHATGSHLTMTKSGCTSHKIVRSVAEKKSINRNTLRGKNDTHSTNYQFACDCLWRAGTRFTHKNAWHRPAIRKLGGAVCCGRYPYCTGRCAALRRADFAHTRDYSYTRHHHSDCRYYPAFYRT